MKETAMSSRSTESHSVVKDGAELAATGLAGLGFVSLLEASALAESIVFPPAALLLFGGAAISALLARKL